MDLTAMERLRGWIGRGETADDTLTPVPAAALAATLDRDAPPRPGDELPPLWHWLYFLPLHRRSEIGPDGHAKRGGFLPPVPLPRRMWAGGRFTFHRPLLLGEAVRRTSTLADVSLKTGRSGALVFVLVRHEITNAAGELALTEEHDIVYRDAPQPGEAAPAPRPAPATAAWRRDIVPDDVLLFRYSALTFNGHRIHYDRRYVTATEGYPGLVVHGPLLATLLVDLLGRNISAPLARFSFRAVRPVFDIAPFAVCANPAGPSDRPSTAALWVQDADGFLAMEAEASFGAR